jgi:hypothetical protein
MDGEGWNLQTTGPRTAVAEYPLRGATKEQLRSILGLREE